MLRNNNNLNLDSYEKRQAFYNLPANSNTSRVFRQDNIIVDHLLTQCKGQLDEISNFVLQFDVENTDAADSISLVPTFNWVNLIEFYSNSQLIDSLRRDQIFVFHSFLDAWNVQNEGRIEGFLVDDNDVNGGLTPNITIPAQSKRTYYLVIPNNVFTTKNFLLPAISDNFQLKLRVYYNTEANIQISGPADKLEMNQITLLCNGVKYQNISALEDLIKKGFELDTLRHRWQSQNIVISGGLSNESLYDIQLSQISGDIELLFVFLQASGAKIQDYYQGTNPYNYALNNLELVDNNGTASGFYSKMSADYIRTVIPMCCQNSLWQSLFSVYMIPFSANPEKTYKENAHVGSMYLDGKFNLRFQPNLDTSLASTPMNLVSIGLQRAKLYIKDGFLTIQ